MTDELTARLADVPDFDEDNTPLEPPAPPRQPSQVYSVRIPVEQIEALRRIAAERNEPPTRLIRQWVLERLGLEMGTTSPQTLVDRVIELEQEVQEQKKALEQQIATHERDLTTVTDSVFERVLSVIGEHFEFVEKKKGPGR